MVQDANDYLAEVSDSPSVAEQPVVINTTEAEPPRKKLPRPTRKSSVKTNEAVVPPKPIKRADNDNPLPVQVKTTVQAPPMDEDTEVINDLLSDDSNEDTSFLDNIQDTILADTPEYPSEEPAEQDIQEPAEQESVVESIEPPTQLPIKSESLESIHKEAQESIEQDSSEDAELEAALLALQEASDEFNSIKITQPTVKPYLTVKNQSQPESAYKAVEPEDETISLSVPIKHHASTQHTPSVKSEPIVKKSTKEVKDITEQFNKSNSISTPQSEVNPLDRVAYQKQLKQDVLELIKSDDEFKNSLVKSLDLAINMLDSHNPASQSPVIKAEDTPQTSESKAPAFYNLFKAILNNIHKDLESSDKFLPMPTEVQLDRLNAFLNQNPVSGFSNFKTFEPKISVIDEAILMSLSRLAPRFNPHIAKYIPKIYTAYHKNTVNKVSSTSVFSKLFRQKESINYSRPTLSLMHYTDDFCFEDSAYTLVALIDTDRTCDIKDRVKDFVFIPASKLFSSYKG